MFANLVKNIAPQPVMEYVVGRRHRVYALGTPKSGTTSVAALFAESCRAEHEPRRPATVTDMYEHYVGNITDSELVKRYESRDKNLLLDMESNCFLAYRPGLLHSAFPDAKYIITIRKPSQWLSSIFDNNLNFPRNRTRTMQRWHEVFFQANNGISGKFDVPLVSRGLYPIDAYLSYWARTYESCLLSLKNAQRLLVGTTQISDRIKQIAKFAGIEIVRGDSSRSHKNRTTTKHGVLQELDQGYVEDSINRNCGAIISHFNLEDYWQ